MDFDLAELAMKASGNGNNKLIYDDKNKPSVMVYIPKFKNSELFAGGSDSTHPAFIVGGKEIAGFWIGKYQAVVDNGRAYSLPGQDPKASINFDAAIGYCTSKGAGWHLATRAEYAAIAWWCRKNGTMPYGNNNYGLDTRETVRVAIPATYGSDGKINHVLTGTGPLSWSHNHQQDGIWDLNGNVWEWEGGWRTVNGEVQILADNNAADSDNPQTAAATTWKAINAADGSLVTPDGSGTTSGTVKMDWISSKWVYSTAITTQIDGAGCQFKDVSCDSTIGTAAKALLISLALCPDGSTTVLYDDDYFWANNKQAERVSRVGGYWNYTSVAGVFSLFGYDDRTDAGTGIGFRPAYYET
jgi:sulfatase modifying factor 1